MPVVQASFHVHPDRVQVDFSQPITLLDGDTLNITLPGELHETMRSDRVIIRGPQLAFMSYSIPRPNRAMIRERKTPQRPLARLAITEASLCL